MKYLELVIKESMRLYPPVPLISRHIPTDTKFGSSPQISSFLIIILQNLQAINFYQKEIQLCCLSLGFTERRSILRIRKNSVQSDSTAEMESYPMDIYPSVLDRETASVIFSQELIGLGDDVCSRSEICNVGIEKRNFQNCEEF
jgi:hypothetical protein